MAALPFTVNSLHKSEIEHHGKFGHTLWRIKDIAPMSRIDIYYATCCISIQTLSTTLPGFYGINLCVIYIYSHPHKTIFYPSNYYDGSNFIRLIWSGNQVEYYTTQNF